MENPCTEPNLYLVPGVWFFQSIVIFVATNPCYCFLHIGLISTASRENAKDHNDISFRYLMIWSLENLGVILKKCNFNLVVLIGILRYSCDIALIRMPRDLTEVNIGPGNGLLPSGNKLLPERMLIPICVAIRRHYTVTIYPPCAKLVSLVTSAHDNQYWGQRIYTGTPQY